MNQTSADNARFPAGAPVPEMRFSAVGGDDIAIGGARDRWTLLVIYRGRHCPLCKTYLGKLDALMPDWEEAGFDLAVISADPAEKAEADVAEFAWTFPVGHSMTEAQMRALGLYVSDPVSEAETDRRFPEPGLFAIRPDGTAHIVAISNAPSARPDLDALLKGLKFVIANNRSPRGLA